MMWLLRNSGQQRTEQTHGDANSALNHGAIHIQIATNASKIFAQAHAICVIRYPKFVNRGSTQPA